LPASDTNYPLAQPVLSIQGSPGRGLFLLQDVSKHPMIVISSHCTKIFAGYRADFLVFGMIALNSRIL
jgi:hypothetical protein